MLTRRRWLAASAAELAAIGSTYGDDRPPVVNPRATDGDDRHQPDWDRRLTVTVGGREGDLVGRDDKVIQAAVDYIARFGSGTVHILPGTYVFRNAVHLPSAVRLLGSGPDTILTKIPSETVRLRADSDWYDQEITLSQTGAFRVGDGVVLQARSPHHGGMQVIKRTLIARSGNRFKLDDGIRKNLWLSTNPTCSSLFPLLTSEHTHDVVIENLTLDGNGRNNANLNGNHGGNIFLQDCNRFRMRRLESRNYNGDGISFQICHDVVVEDCHVHSNHNLGIHPGSGSQRPLIRNNRIIANDQGIFWCWGVKFGLAVANTIEENRSYGISIGHNDTDNVMRDNQIRNSGKIGILFRDDSRGQDFWPNRNLVEHNVIENSGGADGVAVALQGKPKDVTLRNNTVRETRGPLQRIGVRIDPHVERLTMAGNRFSGFSQDVVDRREP